MPIAQRHVLQKWAFDNFAPQLEILDGETLSEELASEELFWIAVKFLHLPGELPPVEDIDYIALKEKWVGITPKVPNFADFHEVRSLARRALIEDQLTQDLPFWLDKLQEFVRIDACPPSFERKVLYELIALRMRGMRDLVGWEPLIRRYFGPMQTIQKPNEAKDAVVVGIYTYGAVQEGGANLSPSELKSSWDTIRVYSAKALENRTGKFTRAMLLELQGYLLLVDPYERDVERGLDTWAELSDVIRENPLFPLESFTDMLTVLAPVIGGNPKYEALIDRTDALLAERVGNFAVADKCRSRALRYLEQSMPVQALREFQNAKVKWFAKETLYGSLLSMLVIGETYRDLHLFQAAKYYAMAALYVAHRSTDDEVKVFVPRALASLVEAEYLNGGWGHFFLHADLGFRALGVYAPSLDDPISESIWERLVFYSATATGMTAALGDSRAKDFVEGITNEWPSDELKELTAVAVQVWSEPSRELIVKDIAKQFAGVPFTDTQKIRTCRWAACGIDWYFTWESGLDKGAATEHLMSILQILLAELGDRDLYLLPTRANVTITFGDEFHVSQQPGGANDIIEWKVSVPLRDSKAGAPDRHVQMLSWATTILIGLSLLPQDRMYREIRSLFEQGLTSKVITGNSYETVSKDVNDESLYESLNKAHFASVLDGIEPQIQCHAALAWINSPLPEFNEEEERQAVRNRYERSIVPLKLTLSRTIQDEKFKETVESLRAEGWKDWHILLAMMQVGMNYRANARGASHPEELRRIFLEEMNAAETPDAIPIPTELFSTDNLKQGLMLSLPSTLKGLGLDLRTNPVNLEAISRFLGERMRYWEIDEPHTSYLPASGN